MEEENCILKFRFLLLTRSLYESRCSTLLSEFFSLIGMAEWCGPCPVGSTKLGIHIIQGQIKSNKKLLANNIITILAVALRVG